MVVLLLIAYLLVSLIFTMPYIIRYLRINKIENTDGHSLTVMSADFAPLLKE